MKIMTERRKTREVVVFYFSSTKRIDPFFLCGMAVRLPTAARCSSEPLRPVAHPNSTPLLPLTSYVPRIRLLLACAHSAQVHLPPACGCACNSSRRPLPSNFASAPQSHSRLAPRAMTADAARMREPQQPTATAHCVLYVPSTSLCLLACAKAKYTGQVYRRAWKTHVCHNV